MSDARLGTGEIIQRGEEIYERTLREKLEPKHTGDFLVLDIETEEYEIDSDEIAALKRAIAKHPEGTRFVKRIGDTTPDGSVAPVVPDQQLPEHSLRFIAERARAGDPEAAEALRRAIETLRLRATITPAVRPDKLEPGWQKKVLALIEDVRAGVPEEWTEEELERRIRQVVAEVRSNPAGHN